MRSNHIPPARVATLRSLALLTAIAPLVALTDAVPRAAAADGYLSNLSVRASVGAGQSLTVGSVTTGSKSLLVRGIGPALGGFGLGSFCPDPQLQVFDARGGLLESNAAWSAALGPVFTRVGAFALAPGSRDTAVSRSVSGAISSLVRAPSAGVVLVELYDADSPGSSTGSLVNVSARTRVGTGDDMLVAGFVVAGDTPRTLLVRGIGPTLGKFGVGGALANPKLTVFAGTRPVLENDDWAPVLDPVFKSAGAFALPGGSRDAALHLTVPPGAYTAQLSGLSGATGEGLIEVYDITGATATAAPAIGASVPWTRYEAEDGEHGGAAQVLAANRTSGDPAGEASGRRAVRLKADGDYVQWYVTSPATALVIRVSIPDAPGGGGLDATLSVYKGNTRVQSIPVTSRHAWLYGPDTSVFFTNNPANGAVHRVYDESQIRLTTTFSAGDVIRIQKDAGDQAAYYDVDLIELENPTELAAPANSISIVAKGATPDDDKDDADAIISAVGEAKATGKIVWMPRGTYRLGKQVNVPSDVTVRGAGMWFTELAYTISNFTANNGAFYVAGGNTKFSDFRIRADETSRAVSRGFWGPFGTGGEIANVWIEHTTVGIWVGTGSSVASNLRFSGCRVRDTYGDGINLCNGTMDSTIENCTTRNTGDDGLALWSYAENGIPRACTGNVIRNCTVECVWLAGGLADYGGRNTLEANYVADTFAGTGINVEQGFTSYPFQDGTVIRNNLLVRCGGRFGQEYPSIWVLAADADLAGGITFTDNTIVDSTYAAVILQCANAKKFTGQVTFDGLTVDGAKQLVWVRPQAIGAATMARVEATNIAQTPSVQNDAASTFTLTMR